MVWAYRNVYLVASKAQLSSESQYENIYPVNYQIFWPLRGIVAIIVASYSYDTSWAPGTQSKAEQCWNDSTTFVKRKFRTPT